MRQLTCKVVQPKASPHFAVLKLKGYINASSITDFENVLDSLLLDKGKDLVVDLEGVDYVNSSGIAALMNYHNSYRNENREVVLIKVPDNVAVVFHHMGVSTLVTMLLTEADALEYLARDKTGKRKYQDLYEFSQKTKRKLPKLATIIRKRSQTKVAKDHEYSVLVIEPESNYFVDVIKLRLHNPVANFTVVHDCVEALSVYQELKPDLVILRDTVPQAEEFLAKIKIERGASLTSVIKVYPRGTNLSQRGDFKIWENDYFVEPFEILELFVLAEKELSRIPEEREIVQQQLHFDLKSNESNVQKAYELGKAVIYKTGLDSEDSAAIFSAYREALENAMRHGNQLDDSRRITVIFTIHHDNLIVEVVDEGEGFDYKKRLKEISDNETYDKTHTSGESGGRSGGLGMMVMNRCADKVSYGGIGNHVRLEKVIR